MSVNLMNMFSHTKRCTIKEYRICSYECRARMYKLPTTRN